MEIVWTGLILACLALSIPFVIPGVVANIKIKTGEELPYDQLYWSIAPIAWKNYRRERTLFRRHCPFRFYYGWTVIHVVFLTVITCVPLVALLQNI